MHLCPDPCTALHLAVTKVGDHHREASSACGFDLSHWAIDWHQHGSNGIEENAKKHSRIRYLSKYISILPLMVMYLLKKVSTTVILH